MGVKSMALGLLIPFLGTILGAGCVFFIKDRINNVVQKGLLGFAAGVMIAAAVWSLIIPAMNMSADKGKLAIVPVLIGFGAGILFLLSLDHLIPHLHMGSNEPEGMKSTLKKKTMLILAVTLHNIPEGMAVGVIFAGLGEENIKITLASAMALSVGIAIQNFPEGAIISVPLVGEGVSKKKAFLYGVLSGIVEPIAALITILLTSIVLQVLPYLLAFAAGAMIYVVVEELIPQSAEGEHSDIATIGFAVGFMIMMALDVVLS